MTASEMAELDRRIAVMQAYRDGKKIQMQRRGTDNAWSETYPAWDWAGFDYRIAPRKPRECWVLFCGEHPNPRIFGGRTKRDAMQALVQATDEVVHMREVLPD